GFTVVDVSVGRFAHGFGTTEDGRPFAFRTVRATLTLEIYRADLDTAVPAPPPRGRGGGRATGAGPPRRALSCSHRTSSAAR
ncbi:hypothetical protein, partial [Nocardia farcinica]|uniref:hypothetical protein n=1 Tax=Nocardia farcinica TaxID=37329 RepID=UPI0024541A14